MASAFSVASSSRTPYLRIGSDSPRSAAPMAWIASSGDVLRKLAKSVASCTRLVENPTRASPARPEAFPKVANVEAPSRASCLVMPSCSTALDAKSATAPADEPKMTFTLFIVSARSDAFLIESPTNSNDSRNPITAA